MFPGPMQNDLIEARTALIKELRRVIGAQTRG